MVAALKPLTSSKQCAVKSATELDHRRPSPPLVHFIHLFILAVSFIYISQIQVTRN